LQFDVSHQNVRKIHIFRFFWITTHESQYFILCLTHADVFSDVFSDAFSDDTAFAKYEGLYGILNPSQDILGMKLIYALTLSVLSNDKNN